MNTFKNPKGAASRPRAGFLLVGNGRLATHFSHYLSSCEFEIRNWNRKDHNDTDFIEKASGVQAILLAISDSAILNFWNQWKSQLPEIPWVHFSGALEHEDISSCHPLMTFGPELYEISFYEQIPLISTSPENIKKVFSDLKNPLVAMNAEQKFYYHALCVLAGNFSQILWSKFLTEAPALNIPAIALQNFAEQSLRNLFSNPKQAMTGPLVRKDYVTQAKNVESLRQDKFKIVYQAFQSVFNKDQI